MSSIVRIIIDTQRALLPTWGNRYGVTIRYGYKVDRMNRLVDDWDRKVITVRNPEMKPLLHNGKARRG